MINEQEVSFTDYFNFDEVEMYDESFLNFNQNDQVSTRSISPTLLSNASSSLKKIENVQNEYGENENENNEDDDGHNNSPQLQTQSSPETKHLEYKDALEIKRKMCPKFANPDCNLLNWTFVQIDAPLYFNYDTADG
ncbi:16466_t:CDS:1, partial [Funneliformis caledonium]